jgi:hypothetical protein
MNLDLPHALHDAVDGPARPGVPHPHGAALDTARLASRIRRRRAVRAGVQGTVGLGAAGAVALGGIQLARPDASVLPAAQPGAAPGTCGSSLDALLGSATDGPLELDLAAAGAGIRSAGDGSWRRDSPTDLGVLRGRELTLAVVSQDDSTGSGPTLRLPSDGLHLVVVHDGTVVSLPVAIESRGSDDRTVLWNEGPLGELLATVGADDVQSLTPVLDDGLGGTVEIDVRTREAQTLAVHVLTCGTDGDTGGAALPTGDYDVYAVRDYVSARDGDLRAVDGPWTLRLLDEDTAGGAVPAGLDADVPIVDAARARVDTLDGTTAAGWVVTVTVEGTDGRLRAERALAAAGFAHTDGSASGAAITEDDTSVTLSLSIDRFTMADARYTVEVTELGTDDGGRELVYRITETPAEP